MDERTVNVRIAEADGGLNVVQKACLYVAVIEKAFPESLQFSTWKLAERSCAVFLV